MSASDKMLISVKWKLLKFKKQQKHTLKSNEQAINYFAKVHKHKKTSKINIAMQHHTPYLDVNILDKLNVGTGEKTLKRKMSNNKNTM